MELIKHALNKEYFLLLCKFADYFRKLNHSHKRSRGTFLKAIFGSDYIFTGFSITPKLKLRPKDVLVK